MMCERCGKKESIQKYVFVKRLYADLCERCRNDCAAYMRLTPQWLAYMEARATCLNIEARGLADVVSSGAEILAAQRAVDTATDSIVMLVQEFIKRGREHFTQVVVP